MAASIGNLAIIISGNARPFQQTMQSVRNEINQIGVQNIFKGGSGGSRTNPMGLQWGSFGRLARSALVSGFGGGLAGALVGVGAMAFGQVLEATLSAVGKIGHQAAMMLADSFQEGVKLQRMKLGINFLAGGSERGGEWLKGIRDLSMQSGFDMGSLGQSMRTLAGSTDELDNVLPQLQAIAVVSASIGAETEQMNRFALAVAQVVSAGRFEAQELNQLTEAGMPIKKLADQAGMSVGKFRAAVKDGLVSVDILAKALNDMGRNAFKMLDEKAKTSLGQLDRIASKWTNLKAEFGEGLLEGTGKVGLLNIIENSIDYLMNHKGEAIAFLESAGEMLKQWSVDTARFAGNLQQAFMWMDRMAQAAGNFQDRFIGTFDSISKAMLSWRDGDTTLAGLRFLLEHPNPIFEPFRQFRDFDKGLGEDWAQRMAESFERLMRPAVRRTFDGIEIRPKLSPELQKMFDGASDAVAGGGVLDKFKAGMKKIDEIEAFQRPGNPFVRGWFAANGDNFDMNPGVKNQLIADQFFALEKALNMTSEAAMKFPAAMSIGSQEAASAITHAVYGGSGSQTISERILEVTKAAKVKQDQQAADIKAIADFYRGKKGGGLFADILDGFGA